MLRCLKRWSRWSRRVCFSQARYCCSLRKEASRLFYSCSARAVWPWSFSLTFAKHSNVFPWMHFGREHTVGHYLDFWSAVLGLSLFPLGYLLHALTKRRS